MLKESTHVFTAFDSFLKVPLPHFQQMLVLDIFSLIPTVCNFFVTAWSKTLYHWRHWGTDCCSRAREH